MMPVTGFFHLLNGIEEANNVSRGELLACLDFFPADLLDEADVTALVTPCV